MFVVRTDTYKVQKVRALQGERDDRVHIIRRELRCHMSGKVTLTPANSGAGKSEAERDPAGNSATRDPLWATPRRRTGAPFTPTSFFLAPRADDPAGGVPFDCSTPHAVTTCWGEFRLE